MKVTCYILHVTDDKKATYKFRRQVSIKKELGEEDATGNIAYTAGHLSGCPTD